MCGVNGRGSDFEMAFYDATESLVSESTNEDMGDSHPAMPQEQEARMNVTTNQSSNGSKNVTITADGDAAEELLQMLNIAGLNGSDKAKELRVKNLAVVDSEPEIEVQEETDEYADAPAEVYQGIDTIIANGDDYNRSKLQDPQTANRAANPMPSMDTLEETMGRKLMQAYEAMKIAK
jgi:hypothetical protein